MKNDRGTFGDGVLYRDLVRESGISKKHKKANMEGPEENNNSWGFITLFLSKKTNMSYLFLFEKNNKISFPI